MIEEEFSQYKNKWINLEFNTLDKDSLYRMKQIIKEIIHFLNEFHHFNYVDHFGYIVEFLEKSDNELSELIPIMDMSSWSSGGRHNSEDIYKQINIIYSKVSSYLNDITDETIKNTIRKNNLDRIL